MKKLLILSLLFVPLVFAGCGGNDNNEPGPGPTPLPRVVAYSAAAAPSGTNIGDAVWSSATPVALDVSASIFASGAETRPEHSTAEAVANQVTVSAITFNDTLWIKLVWADATHDIWRGRYKVDSTPGGLAWTYRDEIASLEDQMMVLFSGFTGGQAADLDVLNWRSLTTASIKLGLDTLIGFAEGQVLSGGAFVADNGTLNAVISNGKLNYEETQPDKMYETGAAYTGYVLYEGDPHNVTYDPHAGWTVGQLIPGYRIDSSLAGASKASARLSKWDTRALSAWDQGAAQYTVILRRPLNTSYTDDINLTTMDSVKTRIGLTNNRDFSVSTGSTQQGLTGYFWLVL